MYYPKVTLLSHPTKEGPKGLGQFLIVCNMDSKTYFTAWEKFEEWLIFGKKLQIIRIAH